MEQWFKLSLLLCLFGFLKELRPSEPFSFEYNIDKRWRNVTAEEVTKEVYAVASYSNLVMQVLLFLITDMCKYKPLIVVSGLAGMGCWAVLLWTTSLLWLDVTSVLFALFSSAEVAYYTYIYAKVDHQHYQKVSSHTRSAILAGRAVSGISSQILVSTDTLNYKELNYISFTSLCLATLWALFLPPVNKSLYFHSEKSQNFSTSQKMSSAFNLMKTHFINAYGNSHVLKWSAWIALSTGGYFQVDFYIQSLYSTIQTEDETSYNGAVTATLTFCGSLAALSAGYLKVDWETKGEVILGLLTLIQGVLIIITSQTEYIIFCYFSYITFGVLYHFMITIASAQVAKSIDEDSYGLIFGINMFFGSFCSSFLTMLVATKDVAFSLDQRGQYLVYGGYHLVIAVVFIIVGLRTCLVGKQKSKSIDDV